MSNVGGKLDLSGINVNKLVSGRKPRAGIQRGAKFSIAAAEEFEEESSCSSTKKSVGSLIFLVVVLTILSVSSSSSSSVTSVSSIPMKKLTPNGLRKIIRMSCSHAINTHCTTRNEGGEYVVNVKGCPVFDFNGIPFTDVYKDGSSNFHIPPSNDMTLEIHTACKEATATYDTNVKYLSSFAEKSGKSGMILKIVWIPVKNCYTDFSLIISKQEILKDTPVSMIAQKELNGVVAYIYEVDGSISGSIQVQGTGCDVPIRIYSERN